MGTVDAMAAILAVWTAVSVVALWAWSASAHRHRMAFVMREPRSHVRVVELDDAPRAVVVDLATARSQRRSA